MRSELVDVVSETGGHLGALGVIELTVALHYVFNTPKDKIGMGRQPSMLYTK